MCRCFASCPSDTLGRSGSLAAPVATEIDAELKMVFPLESLTVKMTVPSFTNAVEGLLAATVAESLTLVPYWQWRELPQWWCLPC
jgi:hypothetical protein